MEPKYAIGVSYVAKRKCWVASMRINKKIKNIYLKGNYGSHARTTS